MIVSKKVPVQNYIVRPLSPLNDQEVDIVAQRMRLTLIEVLGREVGAGMYSTDWLGARVRWHLDPTQCTGEVFLIEAQGQILGHVIVRVDVEAENARVGLFSTIYVLPNWRRRGLGEALLTHGERWLIAQNIAGLATNTSESNAPLISLFKKHGYNITMIVSKAHMVRLSKSLG
jgi:GNAT superfamily N-acetyltransferase